MINDQNITHSHECKCLSWSPIIVGALVAIGLAFLLNLFSVAIGLTAFTTNSDGVEKIALGGLLATAIGIIVSMFGSGWLTGYLAQRHCTKGHIGALYGFLAWCLALIIAIMLASHIQQYISFYTHFISGSTEVVQISGNASAAKEVAISAKNLPEKSLVISTYIIFSLFFLGAFAASLGGDCGMRHHCRRTES